MIALITWLDICVSAATAVSVQYQSIPHQEAQRSVSEGLTRILTELLLRVDNNVSCRYGVDGMRDAGEDTFLVPPNSINCKFDCK